MHRTLATSGAQPNASEVSNVLPAGTEWVLGFLGTQLAGAVAVPVNTRFAEPEIEYVLSDSGAAVVLRPGEPLPEPVSTISSPVPSGALRIRLPESIKPGLYFLRALNAHGDGVARSADFPVD